MAKTTYQACDECVNRGPKLIEIDNRIYCSRECYLRACKRIFDSRWREMLNHSKNEEIHEGSGKILFPKIA